VVRGAGLAVNANTGALISTQQSKARTEVIGVFMVGSPVYF
jgi:hypothetical protein